MLKAVSDVSTTLFQHLVSKQ